MSRGVEVAGFDTVRSIVHVFPIAPLSIRDSASKSGKLWRVQFLLSVMSVPPANHCAVEPYLPQIYLFAVDSVFSFPQQGIMPKPLRCAGILFQDHSVHLPLTEDVPLYILSARI